MLLIILSLITPVTSFLICLLYTSGWSSTNPCYGGTGSGALSDAYETTTLLGGLEDAGYKINTELTDFYKAYREDRPEVGMWAQDWTLPEPKMCIRDRVTKQQKQNMQH